MCVCVSVEECKKRHTTPSPQFPSPQISSLTQQWWRTRHRVRNCARFRHNPPLYPCALSLSLSQGPRSRHLRNSTFIIIGHSHTHTHTHLYGDSLHAIIPRHPRHPSSSSPLSLQLKLSASTPFPVAAEGLPFSARVYKRAREGEREGDKVPGREREMGLRSDGTDGVVCSESVCLTV